MMAQEGKGGHGMGQYLGQLKDKIKKGSPLEKELQGVVQLRNPEAHGGEIHYGKPYGYRNLAIIEQLMALL